MTRRVGFAGLSMRQLAAHFGVSAAALYYHFRNKDHLLDCVAGHVMGAIEKPARTLPWTERLRHVSLSQQAALRAYPGLAPFLVRHRESKGALLWMEMILEVLVDAGFNNEQMARALAALAFFVHPFSLIDGKPHRGQERMYRSQLSGALQADPSRYPALNRMLPTLLGITYESHLPVALDRVIAGIAADFNSRTTAGDPPRDTLASA
jgi:TetR/AcrR family transcriptional regulator, tetracycline repressor protein